MKIMFDVEKSMKMSPPNYPKGVTFKKRIITNRNKLIRDYQIRNLNYVLANAAQIKNSYQINNYLYEEPVKCVEVNEKDPNRFNLIAGYNRDDAESQLGWDTTLVDILEFESPRRRREFMYQTNIIKNPRAGNTKNDITKGISDAIDNDEIDGSDDDDVKSFINAVAPEKTESEKKNIFDSVRKIHSKWATMTPYNAERANKKCEELGLQYQGRKNKNVDGIAYARPKGFSKGAFWDSTEIAKLYGGTTYAQVTIYGYIESPIPQFLQKDREKWLQAFNKMNDKLVENVMFTMDMDVAEVRKKIRTPFVFGGFLPQDQGRNSSGKIKETGLVDQYGNPFIGN